MKRRAHRSIGSDAAQTNWYPLPIVQLFVVTFFLLLLAVVVEAIRRGHLKEHYARLWLGAVGVMLVLATWRSLLDRMGCAAIVPKLFEMLSSDRADIVVGSRFLRRKGYQSAWVRRFRIAILTVFSALVGASAQARAA
jgi:hypothetical protein